MVDKNELQQHADGIITRVKNILTNPGGTWEVVAKETDAPMQVFLKYVMPLAAIGPIAGFIGQQLFPITIMGVTAKIPFATGIVLAIIAYIFGLIGVWVLAFVANLISQQFEGRDDYPAAFRLAAYSLTAGWIAGILGIVPLLGILALLAAFYGIYVFYKGASPVMGVPADKAATYTAVVIVVAIVVFVVIGFINAAITAPMMATTSISISV
ncbi:MAG: Yip1 family protein [Erythrobacter sp.]